MDHPPNPVEEPVESVNPREQGLSTSDPSESVRSESNVPNEPMEALLKISQDMTWGLERLTAPKAPIDMMRRYGAEAFYGTSLEESDKAEFWLERLQRVVEEVIWPPKQSVACAVSLLQSEAYDWWKLALKRPRFLDPMPWDFIVQEFRAKYVTNMYKETKWKKFLNLKQRSLSMDEYEKEFSHLRKYAPESILIEAFQCRQFEDGLNESIKRYLAPVTSLQQKNKFSRGASSSSGKRARESPTE